MTAEARKRQIVEVTLDLIAKEGLRGATMARIAAGAGIRQASLYTHFENRRAILLAALDVVYERIYASRETPSQEDSLERLRQMCSHHLELWATQGERHHAHQLMEFVSGARGEGLLDILAEKHMASIEQYAQVVKDGQAEGKIPEYVDPEQVAWLITGWAFAGDVSHLMGFKTFLEPNVAVHWLDVIFASFVTAPGASAASGTPVTPESSPGSGSRPEVGRSQATPR
jgi:AcrR family transcriptional regulator